METVSSASELEAMRVLIDTKMAEFHKAIKAGKEFAYIKQIYLEAKQLADRYSLLSGCAYTGRPLPHHGSFSPVAHTTLPNH